MNVFWGPVSRQRVVECLGPVVALCLFGCMDRELKPINPCLVTGVSETQRATGIEKVDLLFAVDNSRSMEDEQRKLAEELPQLVETLVSGIRRDGSAFSAAKDLHLGVISTDMGAPGLELPVVMCSGYGGDGRLITTPTDPACPAPQLDGRRFISYRAGETDQDPAQVGAAFGCLARTGAGGCGYEMQLESILKALYPYPEFDIDPASGQPFADARVTFLTADGNASNPERYGHGGPTPSTNPQGVEVAYNGGFLRSDSSEGQSLVAVVLVTDEEDCSTRNVAFLQEAPFSPGYEYLAEMPQVNLRCFNHADRTDETGQPYLWPVERYIQNLKALRRGHEELVIFAAIAGVPPERVSRNALASVDFENEAQREAFYTELLNDPAMQEVPAGANLRPACTPRGGGGAGGLLGNIVGSGASPARRITEVVRGFGENGVIQSICQDSFEPAIDAVIDVIARQLGDVCLPRRLVRGVDGLVSCKVMWDLPANLSGPDAIRSCAERPYLRPEPSAGRGLRCKLEQLAVFDDRVPTGAEGWYYDDFSRATEQTCRGTHRQRIAFTGDVVPPAGVDVLLECLDETQSITPRADTDLDYYERRGLEPPTIGTPCDGDDDACEVRLAKGGVSDALFCHREFNICQQSCESDVDCPPAWVCDTREAQATLAGGDGRARPYCVNPTCGTSQ